VVDLQVFYGGVPGFIAGAGLNYRDKNYSGTTNLNSIPGFVIGDAPFGYEADNLGISLNVKNFTNERYYKPMPRVLLFAVTERLCQSLYQTVKGRDDACGGHPGRCTGRFATETSQRSQSSTRFSKLCGVCARKLV
jgi:hypothetical protein